MRIPQVYLSTYHHGLGPYVYPLPRKIDIEYVSLVFLVLIESQPPHADANRGLVTKFNPTQ